MEYFKNAKVKILVNRTGRARGVRVEHMGESRTGCWHLFCAPEGKVREYLWRDLKVLRIQWLAVTATSGTEGGITPGVRLFSLRRVGFGGSLQEV